MAWKAVAIGGLEPWEHPAEFDCTPYFDQLNGLEFKGVDEYEKDLDDEDG